MTLFFAQAWFSGLQKSLTSDEPASLGGGYAILAWGGHDVYGASPPLLQVLQSLGLFFMNPEPPPAPEWRGALNPKFALGVALTYRGGRDHHAITRWARLPVVLLGTALVGLVFLWGRALLGVWPALAAATLTAFSPNLIGHARVATADLGVTTFMFAAVAAFWWAVRAPSVGRWALCGVLTGLALLSKFTALLLGPVYMVLVLGLWTTRPETRHWRWVARAALPIGVLCWLLVAVGYGFDWDLSAYREGVSRIYDDHAADYPDYFLGAISDEPRWYYNIVAFALKVPLGAQVLLVASAVIALVTARKEPADRETLLFLVVPVLAMVGAAFFDSANPGLRRILPAFPFLLVLAGFAVRAARSALARAGVIAMLGWAVGAGIWIYPHHLSYFNEAAGGPMRGPYLLDDSNIDWGQDLPSLAAWQRTRPPGEELRLMYFGNAVPEAYGVRSVPVEWYELARPRPGFYAMSTHSLVGIRKLMRMGIDGVDWLTLFRPQARAGYSIWIYEFR